MMSLSQETSLHFPLIIHGSLMGGRAREGLLMILHHEVYCVCYNY